MFRFQLDEHAELRLLEERHAEELFALIERNRDHFGKWIPWVPQHTKVQHTVDRIRHDARMFAENGGFLAGIWAEGKLVGVVGLHEIDHTDKHTDIHYWLDEAHRGKGLVTKSCRAVLDHAFNDLGLNRIEIHCDPENIRSRAIPEKLGFTQEGVLRQRVWKNDRFTDLMVYGMLATEWKALGLQTKNPHKARKLRAVSG